MNTLTVFIKHDITKVASGWRGGIIINNLFCIEGDDYLIYKREFEPLFLQPDPTDDKLRIPLAELAEMNTIANELIVTYEDYKAALRQTSIAELYVDMDNNIFNRLRNDNGYELVSFKNFTDDERALVTKLLKPYFKGIKRLPPT